MAANKGTLVNLEREKQFLFSYRKKIRRGKKFIVSGNTRQAIIDEHVRQKIGAFDPDLYERLRREEIEKEFGSLRRAIFCHIHEVLLFHILPV